MSSTPYVIVPNECYGVQTYRPDFIVTNSVTKTKVPDWKRKIKTRANASSYYFRDHMRFDVAQPADVRMQFSRWFRSGVGNPIQEVWSKDAKATVYSKGYWRNLRNDGATMAQICAHATSLSTRADNAAIGKLHNKIRSDLNGLAFLGELRQTIGMLRNPFKLARESAAKYTKFLISEQRAIKQRHPRRKSETEQAWLNRRSKILLKAASGTWLEVKFGLMPAISDSEEILKALDDTVNKFDAAIRIRAKSVPDRGRTGGNTMSVFHATFGGLVETSFSKETEASVIYQAIYNPVLTGSYDFRHRLQRNLGLTLDNFVPALYELAPWSFLVDYVVNLGQLIECSTTSTYGLITCTRTTRTKTVGKYLSKYKPSVAPKSHGTWTTDSVSGISEDERSFNRTTVERTVLQTLPVPSLVFSVPGWGSTKWANVAALLIQGSRLTR